MFGWADKAMTVAGRSETQRNGRIRALAGAVVILCSHVVAAKDLVRVELAPGDYELVADVDRGAVSSKQESHGRLSLRSFDTNCPLSEQYRFFGWTSVDFKGLGAPVQGTRADSRDPENPGVLVWIPPPEFKKWRRISRPHSAPILMVGTVNNSKETRGWRDGGGIGLFVQSKYGRCLRGEWDRVGIVQGNRGTFTLCPVDLPPNKALNPTGLRSAG
jgi:hypothetical protein